MRLFLINPLGRMCRSSPSGWEELSDEGNDEENCTRYLSSCLSEPSATIVGNNVVMWRWFVQSEHSSLQEMMVSFLLLLVGESRV